MIRCKSISITANKIKFKYEDRVQKLYPYSLDDDIININMKYSYPYYRYTINADAEYELSKNYPTFDELSIIINKDTKLVSLVLFYQEQEVKRIDKAYSIKIRMED